MPHTGAGATLAPQLPPHWDRVTVRNLRVGGTTIDVALTQGPGQLRLESTFAGPPVALTFDPAVPQGSTARKTRSPARVGTAVQRHGRHAGVAAWLCHR